MSLLEFLDSSIDKQNDTNINETSNRDYFNNFDMSKLTIRKNVLNSIANICIIELQESIRSFTSDRYYKELNKLNTYDKTNETPSLIAKYFKDAILYCSKLNLSHITQNSSNDNIDINDDNNQSIFMKIIISFSITLQSLKDRYNDILISNLHDCKVNDKIIFENFIISQVNYLNSNIDNFLLLFLLYSKINSYYEMKEIVINIIITTFKLYPKSNWLTSDHRYIPLISCLVQCQYIIYFQRYALHHHTPDNNNAIDICNEILHGLKQFYLCLNDDVTLSTTSLLVVIGFLSRICMTLVAGQTKCYDILSGILKCPLRIEAIVHPTINSHIYHNEDNVLIDGYQDDKGYDYYYNLTRQETIQLLSMHGTGRFVIRPHETRKDSMFLSFRNSLTQSSSDNIEDLIKHAVIRKEYVSNNPLDEELSNDLHEPTKVCYRCGKVGPYLTLYELLIAIDKITSLIFDTFKPSELFPELDVNNTTDNTIDLPQLTLKDPNFDFWLYISRQVQKRNKSINRSDSIYCSDNTNCCHKLNYILQSYDDINIRNDYIDTNPYNDTLQYEQIKDYSYLLEISTSLHSLIIHKSLSLLCSKAIYKRLSIISDHINEILSPFEIKSVNNNIYSNIFLTNIIYLLTNIIDSTNDISIDLNMSTIGLVNIINSIFLNHLNEYILDIDSCTHSIVLPTTISINDISNYYVTISDPIDLTTNPNYILDKVNKISSNEIGEYIFILITKNVPSRTIRKFAALNDLGLYSIINDYYSSSSDSIMSNISNYEYIVEGFDSIDIVTWLTMTESGKQCLNLVIKLNLLSNISFNIINQQNLSKSVDSLVSNNSDNVMKSSKSTPNLNSMKRNDNKNILPSTVLELQNVAKILLSWLVSNKILDIYVKPPENAFVTYYVYRDSWEVKAAIDISTNATSKQPVNNMSKLGRQKYSSVPLGITSASLVTKNNNLFNYTIEDTLAMKKLWESMSGDYYLVHTISSGYPNSDIINNYIVNKKSTGSPIDSLFNPINEYHQTMHRYLYRNAMLARLRLPYRFVASIQIDILGIKEVRGRQDNFSFAHTSAHNIEVYSIIKLVRSTSIASQGATFLVDGMKLNSGTNSSRIENLISTGFVTPSKKVESVKSHSIAGSTMAMNSTEYNYKEILLFKFPLPEECNILPISKPVLNKLDHSNSTDIIIPLIYSPPQIISISIYEKTFFSEKKLGELELNVSNLSDEKPISDWFPLSTDKSGTWLINLQLQLRFSLMIIDDKDLLINNIIKQEVTETINNNTLETIDESEIVDEKNDKEDEDYEIKDSVLTNTIKWFSIDKNNNNNDDQDYQSQNRIFSHAEDLL